MANYVCIRVIARPVEGAEEDFESLCECLEDPEGFIESIDGDTSELWLDTDNFEPAYGDDFAEFQMIAKRNYPRYIFEEGFCCSYVVDYDVVFADESENYNLDYSSDDPDDLVDEVGCIGVYKMKRIPCEDPDDGYDYNIKYFFPQSEEEKHLMYLYAWAESYFCQDTMDRQALYHTNPEDPDDDEYDLREEMDLGEFFDNYKI